MNEVVGSRLLQFGLDDRRAGVEQGAPLAALADGLEAELAPLLEHELPIPERKARMTRAGGRCPVHGDFLEFDPFSPHSHHCARCGRDYASLAHDDWWAMGAQLWTVERAVHGAALFLLRGDERYAALSARILESLADRYRSWPNVDNVLGPSRPFFSTYLESIWLLNACHALDLLQTAEAPRVERLTRHVLRNLVAPSSELIAGFHEGMSNRQVWNEVAVLSALTLMDAEVDLLRRLDSEDGLLGLMSKGLLADGAWYEGENYHLFAHRGLWYGVEMLRARERDHGEALLPEELDARYGEGFVTPFFGVLPDDTFPARRDSKYGVSMRQWRFAEWCELGYAHTGDARLGGILARMYDGRLPQHGGIAAASGAHSGERSRSTADAERNGPPAMLSRASLSWRALLMADVEPPATGTWEQVSACLPEQGLAVIRRDGARTYVALEGGHTGGDHGHPDRLSVTLQSGAARWLDDPGTGSYVERELHWYRSTLAHGAPLFDGASQDRRPAELLAFEDRGGAGWMSKRVADIAPGVDATRTLVVCDGYLVDVLEWNANGERELTLPIAGDASLLAQGTTWQRTTVAGAGGLEDGFDFVSDAEKITVRSNDAIVLDAMAGVAPEASRNARLWYACSTPSADDVSVFRATVPGTPGHSSTRRHWLTVRGKAGRVVGVWSWPAPDSNELPLSEVTVDAAGEPFVTVVTRDGTRAVHTRVPHGWHIELEAGGARSSIDLERVVPQVAASDADEVEELESDEHTGDEEPETLFADYEVPLVDESLLPEPVGSDPGGMIEDALLLPLGAMHYLGTEESFSDAGEPTATVQLARTETHLIADIEAATGPIVAPEPDGNGVLQNDLDNERADVNADGVQWYIGRTDAKRWAAGGLLVPVSTRGDSERPRAHSLVADGAIECDATWRETSDGWAMRLVWRLDALPVDADGCVAFDLIVNERPPERERRRGQLVLSGGGGFSYLRGDRHDPARSLVVAVT